MGQLRRSAWNDLGMDVSGKTVFFPQQSDRFEHPLGGIVWRNLHRRAEKEAFNVISAVKLYGKTGQLLWLQAGPGDVCSPAIDAVLTIVLAFVGEEDFQQGNAATVR